MAKRFRSLWLSDVHLGTGACRAAQLLDFLNDVQTDKIYLVGDIIDLARMKSRPRFPDVHMAVVSRLISLASEGVEVVFIPGNHDFEFRDLAGSEICGIPVQLEAVHETPLGEKWLVMHGDILDGRIRQGTNLEKFGAAAYFLLTEADALINRFRLSLGQDYYSMSAGLKARLSGAREYVERFETFAAAYAGERGFDGVVCGHIHKPGVRMIDGVLYANDGDWVEHGTALAETPTGELRLLGWQQDEILVRGASGGDLLAA